MPDESTRPAPASAGKTLRWLAIIEAWLTLCFAVGAWLVAILLPAYPHVGDPDWSLCRAFWLGVALAPGVGTALAGIRLGDPAARKAGWWALGLLAALLL